MKLPDHRPVCCPVAILLVLTWGLFLPLSQGADANPPERMSYQGFLADANGTALGNDSPRNYTAIFRIYSVSTGGTTLWTEQQTITVDKGYFSVLLGEGSVLGSEVRPPLSSIFAGNTASERFIGITVRGLAAADVEIVPRLQLLAAPYSFLARNAVSLVNDIGEPFVNISSGTLAAIGISAPVQSTGSGGNARGGKAVDLQVTRDAGATGAPQVASGEYSTISGGRRNTTSSVNSTVGGGEFNRATGSNATIGGGSSNQATGQDSTVGGGSSNVAGSNLRATVAGGGSNSASGESATVGGGFSNTASGQESVIPGGRLNTAAGTRSFAAGNRAKANHTGSFVWADSTEADFASGANNEFRVRATGGTTVLGARSTTSAAARQLFVGDENTGTGNGVSLGFKYNNSTASRSGVVQALANNNAATLELNPGGGTVLVGGALQVNGGLSGGGTIPIGGIIMWSGASVPSGWRLCDGGGGTPDLRNRFIVGSGNQYAIGNVGGVNTFTLTDAQVPLRNHSHPYVDRFNTDNGGQLVWSDDGDREPGGDGDSSLRRRYNNFTTGSASIAATAAVDNRPPYFALAFIMRVN